MSDTQYQRYLRGKCEDCDELRRQRDDGYLVAEAEKVACRKAEARAERLAEELRDGVVCVVSLLSGDTDARDDAYQWVDRPIVRAALAADEPPEKPSSPRTETIDED